MPHLDLSHDLSRQTVVADGRDLYQGHPSSILLPDGQTVVAAWTVQHGGPCGPLKISRDGGKSWGELIPVPHNWSRFRNCPTLFHLPTPPQPRRLVVYALEIGTDHLACAESLDYGESWSPMRVCGGTPIRCVMPWCSVWRDGAVLRALSNARDPDSADPFSNLIIGATSHDDGLSWGDAHTQINIPGAKLCEPWVIPSPQGDELACIMRSNQPGRRSMIAFSQDAGASWAVPIELPEELHGDRHVARYLTDGRIIAAFRRVSTRSFDFWIGSWEDLKAQRPGELTGTFLRQQGTATKPANADIGYPGLEVLADGSVLAITYAHYRESDAGNSVVAIRCHPQELQKSGAI